MQSDWCPERNMGHRYIEKRPGEDTEGRMLSGGQGERPQGKAAPQHLGLGLPVPRKERRRLGLEGAAPAPAQSRSSVWGRPGT